MDLSRILKDNWTLVTLTLPDDYDPAAPPTWFLTLLCMTRQAKVQQRLGDAWEFLSDWTSSAADKARRDILTAHDHAHNLFPYPNIIVIKSDPSHAVPELGLLTPSMRENSRKEATMQWIQENPTRPLQRSHYSGVTLGDRAPVILDSSDDPDILSGTQSQSRSHHQLQYQDIQRQTGRKLQNSQSLTNKSRSSAATKRTSISLTSIASAASYNTMIKKLPAHTAEGLIRMTFQHRAPEQENKLVFINECDMCGNRADQLLCNQNNKRGKPSFRYWDYLLNVRNATW